MAEKWLQSRKSANLYLDSSDSPNCDDQRDDRLAIKVANGCALKNKVLFVFVYLLCLINYYHIKTIMVFFENRVHNDRA